MDFSESQKVTTIRGIVREFLAAEVLPLEPALRHDGFVALLSRLAEVRARGRSRSSPTRRRR